MIVITFSRLGLGSTDRFRTAKSAGTGHLFKTAICARRVSRREKQIKTADATRSKDPKYEALYNATRDRLRPIFMSAGTSILGIVPLAIFTGQGSEFDRRLGIAIAGGLAFSTILTPTVIPALMALLQDFPGDRRKHIIGI